MQLFNKIEEGREYEQNFFNSPDSNKILTYEEYYKNYFSLILNYKTIYNEFETNLNELIQSIATLENEDITIDEKRSLQSFLVTPTSTRKLPNFFGTTDELRTTIESVFNSSKNSENYATTLKSREVRNSAWVEMYARNETLLKIDKSLVGVLTCGFDNRTPARNFRFRKISQCFWCGAFSRVYLSP